MDRRQPGWITIALAAAMIVTLAGCDIRDRRLRGQSLLTQASTRISAARALSFSTDETDERVSSDGSKKVLHTQRRITVRQPDRMWFKTSGDNSTEGFYDGTRLTLLFRGENVLGIITAPPSLDATVRVVSERYDIPFPISDLLTRDPHTSYINSKTTGGWEGQETLDGTTCARLEWHHPSVDWTI